nr:hypothetical protein [Paracoccus mutanolyticus]
MTTGTLLGSTGIQVFLGNYGPDGLVVIDPVDEPHYRYVKLEIRKRPWPQAGSRERIFRPSGKPEPRHCRPEHEAGLEWSPIAYQVAWRCAGPTGRGRMPRCRRQRQQVSPGLGQAQSAPLFLPDGDAMAVLELAHGVADGRLRQVQPVGGAAKASSWARVTKEASRAGMIAHGTAPRD